MKHLSFTDKLWLLAIFLLLLFIIAIMVLYLTGTLHLHYASSETPGTKYHMIPGAGTYQNCLFLAKQVLPGLDRTVSCADYLS